jgi:hypothetical protein
MKVRRGSLCERDHPARPEQTHHSFEEGQAQLKRRGHVHPRFSRGQELLVHPELDDAIPRFSRGQEGADRSPEKVLERRFSEGQERRRE